MSIEMKPIGYVSVKTDQVPRSYAVSNLEGELIMDEAYFDGLRDIEVGQRLYVLFHFHKSPPFSPKFIRIKPPVRDRVMGVFSTHSPFRPNPIGLSVLEVIGIEGCRFRVKGLDMLDGTPILDLKPEICPEPPEDRAR